ncbi:MAG TPA: SIMPL domain-containing protein [Dehalococcoidia bacterium]|nr:SIMPL domain-containing protein [Dehalococcoidia bacterium]
MKKWQFLVISLILAGILASAAGCETLAPPPSIPKAQSVLSGIFSPQNTGIWVTGEGKVSVTPDIAILSLGVEAQETTVAEAQRQAAAAMAAITTELDNFGIPEKDIRTQHFSIAPVRRWSDKEGEEILIGYRVTNTITVKVRKVDDAGALIDAVTKAGGDLIRINSISFTVDDPSSYYQEAREKAMADAEAKAKQLAQLAGVKLGEPTYINESGGFVSPPIPYRAETMMPMPAPAAPPTPISPGETEIRLTVQVVYSIE